MRYDWQNDPLAPVPCRVIDLDTGEALSPCAMADEETGEYDRWQVNKQGMIEPVIISGKARLKVIVLQLGDEGYFKYEEAAT